MQFLLVYIREAHALDSTWPTGGGDMPIVEDPLTIAERRAVAQTCVARLDLAPMPAIVDGMDDATNRAYGAWPERLYLVGKDGNIVYHGGPGPYEYDPDELEAAIRATLSE